MCSMRAIENNKRKFPYLIFFCRTILVWKEIERYTNIYQTPVDKTKSRTQRTQRTHQHTRNKSQNKTL